MVGKGRENSTHDPGLSTDDVSQSGYDLVEVVEQQDRFRLRGGLGRVFVKACQRASTFGLDLDGPLPNRAGLPR